MSSAIWSLEILAWAKRYQILQRKQANKTRLHLRMVLKQKKKNKGLHTIWLQNFSKMLAFILFHQISGHSVVYYLRWYQENHHFIQVVWKLWFRWFKQIPSRKFKMQAKKWMILFKNYFKKIPCNDPLGRN